MGRGVCNVNLLENALSLLFSGYAVDEYVFPWLFFAFLILLVRFCGSPPPTLWCVSWVWGVLVTPSSVHSSPSQKKMKATATGGHVIGRRRFFICLLFFSPHTFCSLLCTSRCTSHYQAAQSPITPPPPIGPPLLSCHSTSKRFISGQNNTAFPLVYQYLLVIQPLSWFVAKKKGKYFNLGNTK